MKLIIGTAGFRQDYGNKNLLSSNEIINIVKYLETLNLKTYDTSPLYGDVESFFGSAFKGDLKINTKIKIFTNRVDKNIQDCFSQITRIKKNLSKNEINNVLIHNPWDIPENQRKLFSIKFSQLIKYHNLEWGLSIYDLKDLKGWPKKHGPKIVQAPMNIFDCRFTKKKIENELGYHIKELQIRSIFLQGILLNKKLVKSSWPKNWKNHLDSWFYWVKKNNFCNVDVCVSYLKKNIKNFDKIILGVRSIDELNFFLKKWKDSKEYKHLDNFNCEDMDLIDPRKW